MKDSKDLKKLHAIDKITDDIVLDVDISNIVEKGMEMKIRRDTIKFLITSSIFVSLAGIIALKYSAVKVFVFFTLLLIILIPTSILLTIHKIKGGVNNAASR